MPRRTITDEEIGLIKAMLRRDMRNRDIQFYFNRQDRPVNSGRITGIRTGDYGPEVPEATDAALDAFLATFAPADIGVVLEGVRSAEPTIVDRSRARLIQREDREWYLADGETSDQECKAQFDSRRMEPIIRAIAALANNRGGFIFIGISNADCRVVGMPDTTFQDTDIVRITDKAKALLTPTPIFSKDAFEIGGLFVGVIYVEKQTNPPVIVCRDADGLEDGTILFRYPGQSGKIKFGDLLELLRERDRLAQSTLITVAERLSKIGTDKALIIDTQSGRLEAGQSQITIDRQLANQLEFIREGEFVEQHGAQALRLIGDVRMVDNEGEARERIAGRALTPDAVLKAYLRHERVLLPMEYVRLSVLVQRQWLPLFYFISLSDSNVSTALAELEETQAGYRLAKRQALERLRRETSAQVVAPINARPALADMNAGNLEGLIDRFNPVHIAQAIQALPDGFNPPSELRDMLLTIYSGGQVAANLKSLVFRAASRLDELEFDAREVTTN
jgi:hypothetical protein